MTSQIAPSSALPALPLLLYETPPGLELALLQEGVPFRRVKHANPLAFCGGRFVLFDSRRVGPAGRVVGVDMTEEMVAKARNNAQTAGVTNVEFHTAGADSLPVGAGTVDVVISNGVFNLCLDKPRVVAEVFRVLRPGGRVQLADILLDENVTAGEVEKKGAWSD